MNVSENLIVRLKNSIKCKDIFLTQARECDIEASMDIAELFAPYLKEIQQKIYKENYILGINPWIDDFDNSAKNATGIYENAVKMNFLWEPISYEESLYFHDVAFSAQELSYINKMLRAFSVTIGLQVKC